MSDEGFSRDNYSNRRPRERRNVSTQGSRPSVRSSSTAYGQTRERSARSSYSDEPKVQTPAANRRSQGATSSRRSSQSSTRQRTERSGQAQRAPRTRTTERPSQFRRAPEGQTRTQLGASRRVERVTTQQPSLPLRILGVIVGILGAIASGFVSLMEHLQDFVPALQRVSANVLAAGAAVLIVGAIGVGFAFGSHGNEAANQEAYMDVQTTEEEQASEPAANAVNPDEPADLVWRDTDFAVDPSFTGWATKDNGRKVVYLTIDDGPSELTEKYLDLFDQYNVKATFFVTGHDPNYYHVIKDAYNRGHTIGLHSMTHDYPTIYASEEAFLKDLDEVGQVVKEQIGFVPCFIRFPGGSSNTISEDYSPGLMRKLTKTVVEMGYQYYDWNLDTGDGAGYDTPAILASATEETPGSWEFDPSIDMNLMLLCHDSATKQSTLDALPTIIEFYQKRGYSFEAIDRTTWACHHNITPEEEESTESGSSTDGEESDGESEDEESYDGETEETADEEGEGEEATSEEY